MTVGRRNSATRLAALAVALFAGMAAAASAPDDFAGHWVGMGQEKDKAAMASQPISPHRPGRGASTAR